MRRTLWVLSVCLAAVAPRRLNAQTIRGVVRDSAARIPIPGVVVTVLDSSGTTIGRAITDAVGAFDARVPFAAARLRLLRIGYRPRDVTMPRQRDGIELAMETIPPLLEAVRVAGGELCPGSPDRGSAFQLWEQARAGLLATIVARDLKPADAKTLMYESILSPNDETVRRQTARRGTGRTSRPFVASASPSFFAATGYMIEGPSGRVFNAPDADVLLHESFAATHCFRLRRADSAHAGQLGIAFTPAPGRDTLVDVEGVIWMDANGAQLRSLDFTYTSLEPAAMAVEPGGHIVFRSMPNGLSLIERWSLRLPNLRIDRSVVAFGSRGPRRVRRWERTDVRLTEIVESGGMVTQAAWSDGTRWVDTPAVVTGSVKRRREATPVVDAVVTLVGTSDSTVTDSAGRFQLAAIPGRYVLRVADTTLQDFLNPRVRSTPVVIARARTRQVQLDLPDAEDVVADACRRQRSGASGAIITGYVSTADASPLDGLRVRAAWPRQISRTDAGLAVTTAQSETDVDDAGRFLLCGLNTEVRITLEIYKESNKIADTSVVLPPGAATTRLLWALSAGPGFATLMHGHSEEARTVSERHKPHNGRDRDGNFRVRQVDVEDVLEDPNGVDYVQDDVRLGGAVADVGPHAADPAQRIGELISDNREDVDRVTGKRRDKR